MVAMREGLTGNPAFPWHAHLEWLHGRKVVLRNAHGQPDEGQAEGDVEAHHRRQPREEAGHRVDQLPELERVEALAR